MAAEFTQEVSSRLESDHYGWLTTVAKSGQPVPRLVWFYFDGTEVIVYSMPNAAKVRHVQNHPRVSLNLDSDGNGAGIITVGGEASVDATDADPRDDEAYWAKYKGDAERFGLADAMADYNTRLKIAVTRCGPPRPRAESFDTPWATGILRSLAAVGTSGSLGFWSRPSWRACPSGRRLR